MSLKDELCTAAWRKSAWIMWIITAVTCFLLGHLVSHGWHW